jgi:hypothetical protein
MAIWTSGVPSGFSQFSGLLSPASPRCSARAAIPSRNSGVKLSRDSCGTPSAFSPWYVNATVIHASLAGSSDCVPESTKPASRRTSSRPSSRSSMRSIRYAPT